MHCSSCDCRDSLGLVGCWSRTEPKKFRQTARYPRRSHRSSLVWMELAGTVLAYVAPAPALLLSCEVWTGGDNRCRIVTPVALSSTLTGPHQPPAAALPHTFIKDSLESTLLRPPSPLLRCEASEQVFSHVVFRMTTVLYQSHVCVNYSATDWLDNGQGTYLKKK